MNKLISSASVVMTALPALFMSAFAHTPKTECSPRYIKVTNIERTDSSLRMGVRLQHFPGYWVMIPSSTRLIAVDDTTRQYKITGAENFQLDTEIWMPDSCCHHGVLIFEKVPDDVGVVDLVESNQETVKDNVLGIHLDESDTLEIPDLITESDIIGNNRKTTETWTGFDPARYADLPFYTPGGTAHVRGRVIDYSPRAGISAFSLTTEDNFTNQRKVNTGTINPDGSFEIDVPATYPQFNYFELGELHKNIFLMPGDTLSMVTSLSSRVVPDFCILPEYFGYEGEINDCVTVNLLSDSLINKRYSLNALFSKYQVADTDSMKSETYKNNERLCHLLDSLTADLPLLLGKLPISNFAKDVLSVTAIGSICEVMEDLDLYFKMAKGPRYSTCENGEATYSAGDTLSMETILAPRMRHKDIIYNNPLLLCKGFVLPNRWEFGTLFDNSLKATYGIVSDPENPNVFVAADNFSIPYEIEKHYLDSLGIGNCFAAQFVRTRLFLNNLHTMEKPSSEMLERAGQLISHLIKHNDCQALNYILMPGYNDFVKDVMIAENALGSQNESAIIIEGTPGGEILDKIISPYRGNVLFLDFWGIGCGPCRSGMIKQKPLLEKLSGKPFKALYIANGNDQIEACKKWLSKEGIEGEHIFVTDDNWKHLCGLFNIIGIPFGVLIDKDGNVIKSDYHISDGEPLLEKALSE